MHFQILLKHNDNEEPVCDELGPILHWAAGNDKRNLVRGLLSLKTPKVDINNENEHSPLTLAATRGFIDMVRLLIDEGKADVNYIGLLLCLYTIQFSMYYSSKFIVNRGSISYLVYKVP